MMEAKVKIKFLGGVAIPDGNLTGSCLYLEVEQAKRKIRILVDAGLRQGGKNAAEQNKDILNQIKITDLDYIILTHSHIDHIGRTPLLVRHGFRGRIICTTATAELLPTMLEDSAKIQIADATRKNIADRKRKNEREKEDDHYDYHGHDSLRLGNYDKRRKSKKLPKKAVVDPLYNLEDVMNSLALIKNGGFNYKVWIRLGKDLSLRFYPSGHVLGGAIAVLRIKSGEDWIHFGLSGDLGRQDGIILPPPELVEEPLDYWLVESTYGGRTHPRRSEEVARLLAVVKTAILKKQKIIIPSFALERTQEIVYILSYYINIGKILGLPIYLDSPMAAKITQVFEKNWESGLFNDQGKLNFNPFSLADNPYLETITDQKSSNALVRTDGPAIIIAASGMCDAGRVREHLRAGLGSSNTVVILVGYMAKNSLGRKLKEGLPIVTMNDEDIVVKAKIVAFESFSAHADSPHLISYTRELTANSNGKLKKIFINHGEERSATYLKYELLPALADQSGNWIKDIVIPRLGEEFVLI